MAEKIGVYICGGCDIAAALKTEEIATSVKNKYGGNCPVIKTDAVLCSPSAVAAIKADIKENSLDAVCLCACSPRVKWDVFAFDVLTERVNIREFCVWSFDKQTSAVDAAKGIDNLTIMAQEYALMGVVKLTKSSVPNPETLTTNKTILVLGGGFAGLNAALEAAASGYEVVLVERKAELGGRALGMYKSIPLTAPYSETQETGIDKLVETVKGNAKIKVLASSELKTLGGAPGLYTASIETAGAARDYAIGAVIVATGWEPQAAEFLEPMGYGKIKNVVTAAEFEAMAKKGAIARPSDGKMPATVAFVLDIGLCLATPEPPREDACANPAEPAAPAEGEAAGPAPYPNTESCRHLSYSSELTSLVALKQAGYLREKNENGLALIIYDHMMVPGLNERYYKTAQDDPGVMLTKGSVASLTETAGGQIVVNCRDSLLGENIELVCDMVVLPTGMVPTTAHEPTVNLVYRQGPQFPDLGLFDGFADSNYICFPYETRRTGVYAAGCVHQPMTMAQAADDAAGAALKAIQCISSINRGVAVHPRSGDKSYPIFNFVRCTQCKRCTEECPFGALDDDEKGTPKPNSTRCRRCGTCMGACPERVISFDNYNVDQIGTMIREMGVPPTIEEGGPRVLILACENDAYPALDMAAFRKTVWSPYVRFISVRCLGSVNAIWVADAMSKGIYGVMLLGCKYGDDYQCHFVKDSELCNRRKENIAESLKRLGVEPERVDQYQVSIDEYDRIPALIESFMDMIKAKGPNPFKGY